VYNQTRNPTDQATPKAHISHTTAPITRDIYVTSQATTHHVCQLGNTEGHSKLWPQRQKPSNAGTSGAPQHAHHTHTQQAEVAPQSHPPATHPTGGSTFSHVSVTVAASGLCDWDCHGLGWPLHLTGSQHVKLVAKIRQHNLWGTTQRERTTRPPIRVQRTVRPRTVSKSDSPTCHRLNSPSVPRCVTGARHMPYQLSATVAPAHTHTVLLRLTQAPPNSASTNGHLIGIAFPQAGE